MILPLERPLVALDVETNGLEAPEKTRIVELGFHIEYPDGREPKRWVSLIDPQSPIAREATSVHGITEEKIRGCIICGVRVESHPDDHVFKPVPKFSDVAANLAKGLHDCDYCGYNVRFDLRVVAGEMARAGVPWTVGDSRMIDGMHLWRVGVPRTLSDAVREFLHREPTEAHRALGDAEDALDVAMAQLERWPKLPRNVRMLHDLCFDTNNVDPDGKFIWDGGEIICNFGKHGQSKTRLKLMPRDYLEWILRGDFSADVKKLVQDALNNVYPTRT